MSANFRSKCDIVVTESFPTISSLKGEVAHSLVCNGMYVRCVNEKLFREMFEAEGIDHFRKRLTENREMSYNECKFFLNLLNCRPLCCILVLVVKELVEFFDQKKMKTCEWEYYPWFNLRKM